MTPLSSALRRPRSLQVALLRSASLPPPVFPQSRRRSPRLSGMALARGRCPAAFCIGAGGGRIQLALDSNGTLFRSDDQGKRWHQIKQQWDGKAVELLGIPAFDFRTEKWASLRSDADQETYAAVLLKSTTALHWVSVDRGKPGHPPPWTMCAATISSGPVIELFVAPLAAQNSGL